MVTKREYLIEKGLAKAGRGRLSATAHDAIKDAINKGIKFTDGSESVASDVLDVPDARTDRPEGRYTFMNPDGTTFTRLHTEACTKCCASFQWCFCVSGPVQWAYNSATGEYATLHEQPVRAAVVTEIAPRRRGRPRKAA